MKTDFERGRGWSGVEQGAVDRFVRSILILAFAALAFGGFALVRFRGLTDGHAMEQAQLARSLARGEGFTTRCLRPADLAMAAGRTEAYPRIAAAPDVRNAPGYPVALSLVFRVVRPAFAAAGGNRIFDAEKTTVVPFGITCCVLTGILVLLLGNRLFEPPVGFVGMLVWFVTPGVLEAAISGSALPLQMLLSTAAVLLAVLAVQADASGRGFGLWPLTAAAGLVSAGCMLCGWIAAAWLPALILFFWLALDRRRLPAVLLFVMVAAAALAPWLLRNRAVSGHWFGAGWPALLNGTFLYPEQAYDRSLDARLAGMYLGRVLQRKLVAGLGPALVDTLQFAAGGILATAFFLLSYLCPFQRREAAMLRWGMLGGILYILCAHALSGGSGAGAAPVVAVLWAPAVLYAAAYFHAALDAHALISTGWQSILTWLLVIVTALPALAAVLNEGPQSPYPPYYAPLVQTLDSILEPGDAVCTDIPAAVAWYSNRPAVLLPETVDDFLTLHREHGPLHGLYLTTRTADRPYMSDLVEGRFQTWLPIINRHIPPDFPLPRGVDLPAGRRDQLLLTDRLPAP